jgi:hypothetical protein
MVISVEDSLEEGKFLLNPHYATDAVTRSWRCSYYGATAEAPT